MYTGGAEGLKAGRREPDADEYPLFDAVEIPGAFWAGAVGG